MLTRNKQATCFVVMTLVGLLLYLPFASVRWDLNGIIEAQSVDAGGKNMFSPNHMLYRPAGFAIFKFWQSVGYEGNSAAILQHITAVSAALGIGFLFLALYYLTDQAILSMIGAGFFAISWSYWKFSIDVAYAIPAAMFVSATLALLLRKKPSGWSVTTAGFVAGLSILFWQANIFLVPSAVIALLWLQRAESIHARLTLTARFLVTVGLVVGLAYTLVPILIFGQNSLTGVIGWAISHGSNVGGRAPMWGKWDVERLLPLAENAIASFIPIWQGLGLRNLLRGDIQPDKALSQLSLLSLLVLSAYTLFLLGRPQFRKAGPINEVVWLILAYAFFLPFIFWWEPYETRWFIVPNIFLIAAMTRIWSYVIDLRRLFALGGCIALIGIANFSSTIWPYHSSQSPKIRLAECFAKQTTTADTFIPTDWTWFGYATYFFGYQGKVLELKRGGYQDQQHNLELIENELAQKQQRGGNIYVTNTNSYSQEKLEYFTMQVGIPMEIFSRFEQSYAFTCNELQFMKILHRK